MDLSRTFMATLLAVHGFLGMWALVGYVEWFTTTVPWPRVSNPAFPRDILFMQWGLTLAASVVFMGGYLLRWERLPVAMACVYAAMAALCAVQTLSYLTGGGRFVAMIAEYLAYAGILLFLFRYGPELVALRG